MNFYTINVAKADGETRYYHHFRVITDFQTKDEAESLYFELAEKYPEPDYQVSISQTQTIRKEYDPTTNQKS